MDKKKHYNTIYTTQADLKKNLKLALSQGIQTQFRGSTYINKTPSAFRISSMFLAFTPGKLTALKPDVVYSTLTVSQRPVPDHQIPPTFKVKYVLPYFAPSRP